MEESRRALCLALPLLLGASNLLADEKKTLPSKIYNFNELPVQHSGDLTYRNMLDGMTYEGCGLSLHESALAAHSRPHPPHRHVNEEMILVVEGTLEITINGNPTLADEGSVAYVASNDLHGIRNPGNDVAKYFIFELGL